MLRRVPRLRPGLRVARAASRCSTSPSASSRPGRPLRTDDVMLWYSAGQAADHRRRAPAVGAAALWSSTISSPSSCRAGVPARSGRRSATSLTHTGGFPMFGADTFDRDVTYAEGGRRGRGDTRGVGAGHGRRVSHASGVADPRRDRRSRRRSIDRSVRARRGPRAARRVGHVARGVARRAGAIWVIVSCRSRGRDTCSRRSTPTAR